MFQKSEYLVYHKIAKEKKPRVPPAKNKTTTKKTKKTEKGKKTKKKKSAGKKEEEEKDMEEPKGESLLEIPDEMVSSVL